MNEHSDAAKAAYPDTYDVNMTWRLRTAYDRGREDGEETRDAYDSMELPTTYAVTREALAELLLNATEPWSTSGQIADAILASGVLVDVSEVKAQQREIDAVIAWPAHFERQPSGESDYTAGWNDAAAAIAASIRNGRP